MSLHKKVVLLFIVSILSITAPAFAGTSQQANHESNALVFQIIQQQIDIKKADVQSAKLIEQKSGGYAVAIELTPAAAKRLAKLTAAGINQEMVLTVGDRVINRATIRSELGAQFQITTSSKKVAEKVVADLG